MVEDDIANSRPLRNRRLHCLMPKGASTELVEQPQDLICSKNQHMELEEMVDLLKPNPPWENDDRKDGGLTLLGFSQIYDQKYEVSDTPNDGIPVLIATSKQIKTRKEAIIEKEMPYAKIEASLNNSPFELLLLWGCFCCLFLSLVVLKILWADDNWFSSIITLLQYLRTTTTDWLRLKLRLF